MREKWSRIWKTHGWWLLRLAGVLLVGAGIYVAYWWFYQIEPVRRLAELSSLSRSLKAEKWKAEEIVHSRLGYEPDLIFRSDRIGHYGDKKWALWVFDHHLKGAEFLGCGCTEAVLMYMTNQQPESWSDWLKKNREKSQEEWLRDGFQEFGVTVHLPPQADDIEPLLHLLDKDSWKVLFGGRQKKPNSNVVPDFIQYNAFRWLRDSGFNPTTYAQNHASTVKEQNLTVALVQYAYWDSAYRSKEGLGILAFGKESEGFHLPPPRILTPSFQLMIGALILLPILGGGALIAWSFRKST